jgi:hypothetical protein
MRANSSSRGGPAGGGGVDARPWKIPSLAYLFGDGRAVALDDRVDVRALGRGIRHRRRVHEGERQPVGKRRVGVA